MQTTFTLISEFNIPVAAICDGPAELRHLHVLYSLLPDAATLSPELSRRWNCGPVLCGPEWTSAQLKRTPMFPPKGHRLAFLASVFLAIGHCLSAIASAPTQGSAASDLLAPRSTLHASSSPSLPSLPIPLAVIPPALPVQTNYFAATAISTDGLESDYSNEATNILMSTNSGAVALAWDASAATNIATYVLYTGSASRAYTATNNVGTNLTAAVWVIPPPLTNLVLTVTASAGASNLVSAPTPRGPWTLLGTINYIATNPPSPRYFRAKGASGCQVNINSRLQ